MTTTDADPTGTATPVVDPSAEPAPAPPGIAVSEAKPDTKKVDHMPALDGMRGLFVIAGPLAYHFMPYWMPGGIIGTLLLSRFSPSSLEWSTPFLFMDITYPRLIGAACILACFVFNYFGMRPAVWFSYATGAMMIIPVACLAIIPILKGQLSNIDFVWDTATINANVEFYGGTPGMTQAIILGIVWFWVIAWSSYFPEAPATFAPEYHNTHHDTRNAVLSTSIMGVVLCLLLPLTVVAVVGMDVIAGDLTYIAYLTTALDDTVGTALGAVFTVFLCAGLLLSMNTATMDGSRALYGMATEGLTVKWLAKLNDKNVPGRAMAFDMLLNLCLLFMMPSLLFTLLAGNIGYVLAHILALSGFLLLRRDRPNWPRPLKLGGFWIFAAWLCIAVNVIGTIFGVLYMQYTGYLIKGDDVTGYRGLAIAIFIGLLVVSVVGFIIGQAQAGKKFSLQDKSEEEPTPHVYELMGQSAPSGD